MNELTNLAESVKNELNLKYDEASVQFIEGFIERNRDTLNDQQKEGLINSLGSFLGRCIIENFGGEWQRDVETGSITVAFDDKNKVYPFAKVGKQFKNGLDDSVYSFYRIIPTIFKLAKKKKAWWKRFGVGG